MRSSSVRVSGSMMPRMTRRKPSTAGAPASTVGVGEDFALTFERGETFQGFAGVGQGEMALAAVAGATGLRDIVLVDECGEDAGEALLGDAQDGEKIADGDAGGAADEVDGAVVGATKAEIIEHAVGGGGEVAIGEEEEILGLPHLFLAEEEVAGAGGRLVVERAHCRPRRSWITGKWSRSGLCPNVDSCTAFSRRRSVLPVMGWALIVGLLVLPIMMAPGFSNRSRPITDGLVRSGRSRD